MLQPVVSHVAFDEDYPWVVARHREQVSVTGVLDEFTADAVEGQLLPLATTRPELVVDLTETRLLTSGGLSMLVRCVHRAAALGHRVRLRAAEKSVVQRVLHLSRVPHEVVPAA